MASSSHGPKAATAAPETVAPSRATATSSRVLALKVTPGDHSDDGVHTRRRAAPIRMASTSPSIHA